MEAIEQRLIEFTNENKRLQANIKELEKQLVASEARFVFVLYAFFGVALLFMGFSVWSLL